MTRHGRAVMPWGKFKGVRVRLLPDDYLSWLTEARYQHDEVLGRLGLQAAALLSADELDRHASFQISARPSHSVAP